MADFIAGQPYNDLPPLPPEADVESKAVLKACIKARAALAELRKAGEMLPNQSVLINSLPLLEAQASSEIENIVTTTDRLFHFASGQADKADPATKEALQYRTALFEGYLGLRNRPITTRTAETLCSAIKGVDMSIRQVPGTSLGNDRTGEIIYTPPVGEYILRDKLANWEHFIHSEDDIDPLIKMAIAHYQFEAIHPFTDGNGRTGRILNILYLIELELLEIPVLYLSRFIIQHKADYYRLLLGVTQKGDWEPWILYMLKAVEETAGWTCSKIDLIIKLMDETRDYIKTTTPQFYSYELSELLFTQPYCRIKNLVDAGIAKRQTAAVYLKQLAKVGVLNETKVGRENIYINPRFMSVLMTDNTTYQPLAPLSFPNGN